MLFYKHWLSCELLNPTQLWECCKRGLARLNQLELECILEHLTNSNIIRLKNHHLSPQPILEIMSHGLSQQQLLYLDLDKVCLEIDHLLVCISMCHFLATNSNV